MRYEVFDEPIVGFSWVEWDARAEEWRGIGEEARVVHFGSEIPDEFARGDRMAFSLHVLGEDPGHRGRIQHASLMGVPEIEQVTTLSALVKRSQLGA